MRSAATMILPSFLQIAFIFLQYIPSPAAASPIIIPRDESETVRLVYCEKGGRRVYAEVSYYQTSRDLDFYPPSSKASPVFPNGNLQFEGQTVSATFGDGNVFTSRIQADGNGPRNSPAGYATNNFREFQCYTDAKVFVYSDGNGYSCLSYFYCKHGNPFP